MTSVGAWAALRAGQALTERQGMADALALEVEPGVFDVVWAQNSGMNGADKKSLYADFARALRPGGLLALQEPMAGPVHPVMWARDASASCLRTPGAMRAVIEASAVSSSSCVVAGVDVNGDELSHVARRDLWFDDRRRHHGDAQTPPRSHPLIVTTLPTQAS